MLLVLYMHSYIGHLCLQLPVLADPLPTMYRGCLLQHNSAHLNHGIILFLIDDGVKNLWEDVRKREAVRSGKVADLEQELAENKAKQDELRRELLQLQRKEESLQADKKRLELEHEFVVKVS